MSDAVVSRVMEAQKFSAGTEFADRLSGYGSKVVTQFEPPFLELSRRGQVFSISGGVVANAAVPVLDVGTTAAAYSFWNGEAVGGKVCVPLLITVRSASGTLGLGASLMLGLSPTVQASAVANSTGVVGPGFIGGSTAVSSNARLATGITLAGSPAWVAVASTQHVAAVSIGAGLNFEPKGLWIVRPQYALGIAILAPTGTTAKFTADVVWAEMSLDLV